LQRPKANSIDLQEISCTHSQNLKKNCFKILKGSREEISLKNKMNVEKFKSDQNIWNFLFVKCCIYSQIELFFLNIAKNLLPRSHFGHSNKDVFSQKIGAVYVQ